MAMVAGSPSLAERRSGGPCEVWWHDPKTAVTMIFKVRAPANRTRGTQRPGAFRIGAAAGVSSLKVVGQARMV